MMIAVNGWRIPAPIEGQVVIGGARTMP